MYIQEHMRIVITFRLVLIIHINLVLPESIGITT